MKNKPTVTVGIPTYLAGKNLISTLNSLYQESNVELIEQIIIVVDGKRMSSKFLQKIKHPKLKVFNFKKRLGQSHRMNDLIKIAKTDILIFTNDDVLFDSNSINNVISEFKKGFKDLICAQIEPIQPKTLLELSLKASDELKREVINNLPGNRTYLISNGRFLALSKKLYKEIKLPRNLINSDAYIYFFALKNFYKIKYMKKIVCFFKEPSKLSEYMNQVNKFQMSFSENSRYFDKEFLQPLYNVPLPVKLKVATKMLLQKPIYGLIYFLLFTYVRILNLFGFNDKNYIKQGIWKTDLTTKSL